ncbi:GNAT family N-acetyltransferase [Oceanirhabdus seepicola]|uniref:GNAT family N-acetyltransferase n=1 Tax=Oceanirhabdus seepicola TaxID=2828781 RepID=A0A9J6P2W9_9CLOT|nr:GNAT family protein [Oceanirhabdus seepicola]MCM1990732.1 GNAT family N-acetyltransferase [Oceanirhabdus seepicola]
MIKLISLEKKDIINIIDWNKDKDADFLMQWAGRYYTYPITEEQIITRLENKNSKSDINIYKIVLDKTNEMIGTVELFFPENNPDIAVIGRFLIEEAFRGNGYGEEALKETVNKAFDKFGFNKVVLGVFEFNKNAIKCYEKVGFIKDKLREDVNNPKFNSYTMTIHNENN